VAGGQSHLLRRARKYSALVGVLIVAGVAGCGGNSSNSTSATSAAVATTSSSTEATPAPTHASLSPMASAAEKICGRLNARLDAEPKTLNGFGAVPGALSRRARVENAALIELATLKPPDEIANAWAQILRYRQALKRNLLDLVKKARRNEFSTMNSVYAANVSVERKLLGVKLGANFEPCLRVG